MLKWAHNREIIHDNFVSYQIKEWYDMKKKFKLGDEVFDVIAPEKRAIVTRYSVIMAFVGFMGSIVTLIQFFE